MEIDIEANLNTKLDWVIEKLQEKLHEDVKSLNYTAAEMDVMDWVIEQAIRNDRLIDEQIAILREEISLDQNR